MSKTSAEGWSTIIQAKTKWFDVSIRELFEYWDLIVLFIKRDFVTQYKQTILGPLWFFIQPLMTTGVFTVVFGGIAQMPTDGLPQILFYNAGITAWNYFINALGGTANTFSQNAGVFGKVYFPRLTVPISVVLTKIFTFFIQFGLFLVLLFWFMANGADIRPNWWILATPLMILHMAVLGLGMGIWISSLTTKYRDLQQLISFGLQLWMYATPVVYPISYVPESWRWLVWLNPMSPVVEFFRYAYTGQGVLDPTHYGISLLVSGFILLGGLAVFHRIEKTFMDTV